MDWLREHTQDQLTSLAANDLEPCDTPRESSSALDLVYQAADVLRDILDHAADSEARAKAFVEDARARLQLAEALIDSAKSARALVEETRSKLIARLQETERELTQTPSRIPTGEAPAATAAQHMSATQIPTVNAEQIKDQLRVQLVRLHRNRTGPSLRAA